MTLGDPARFGLCSETDNIRTRSRNATSAQMIITAKSPCYAAHAGRCWLHYLMEYEYLTASGRWLEGEISPEVAASLNANEAVGFFDRMDWFHCSGSALSGKLRRVNGPAATWLTPFSVK